jgi:hypothetical protein
MNLLEAQHLRLQAGLNKLGDLFPGSLALPETLELVTYPSLTVLMTSTASVQ